MLLYDIIATIEKFADPACAASWDRSGLQVASSRLETGKMAVMLDPLPDQVKKALDWGARFVLSHHPLSLKPDLPRELDNYYYVLKYLLGADAALYAAHTSLDVNLAGPAGWLARALGLKPKTILDPVADGMGYGLVGELPEPVSFADFMDKLASILKLEELIVVKPLRHSLVTRVAFCGGSGGSLIKKAEELGAQVYITGDIRYHAALDTWLCLIDAGHHSMEEKMMELFAEDLRRDAPGLEIKFFASRSPFSIYRPRETGND